MPAQQKELKTETEEKKYMIESPPKKSPNACSLPSLPLIAYGGKGENRGVGQTKSLVNDSNY